jgi:hypothetical protein
MDPSPLGNFEWTEIGKLLVNLWIITALIIFFAANILVGHIFIPSLVASHHIPPIVQRTRVAFYGAAVVSFGLAIFFLLQVIELSDVLARFWHDYWI